MLMILCGRYNEYIEVVLVLSGMLLMILFFNFCEMYRWYDLMYFEWLNDFKFLNYFKKIMILIIMLWIKNLIVFF